jgi:hypothetical protein
VGVAAPAAREIARQTAGLERQLSETLAPFGARITAAHAEAQATDREAETARAIAAITPEPEQLRTDIDERFVDLPAARWLSVLEQIADATAIGNITLNGTDEGDAS